MGAAQREFAASFELFHGLKTLAPAKDCGTHWAAASTPANAEARRQQSKEPSHPGWNAACGCRAET
jgi:hypothetical protein